MKQRRGLVLVAVGLGLLALVGLLGALKAAEAGLHASATGDVAEGLVLHYKFDDTEHLEVYDSSGLGNTGLPFGGEYTTTTPPLWVPNVNAFDFDGDEDYIVTLSPIDLSNRSFSVAFWARRDITGTGHIAVSQGDPSVNNGLHIGFRDSNHFTFAFWNNDLNTPTAYTDSDWHHWACTYDADTPERIIYYDGTAVAMESEVEPYQGGGPLVIGSHLDPGYNFDGLIDEVRVYTRALGAPEVAELAFKTDTEADTLMALYYSTTGISWTVKTNWGTDTSYCEWYGIACIGDGVSEISLNDNHLSGTIPSALGTLGSLEILDLGYNNLTGTIPAELGELGELMILNLYSNSLSGTIPPGLGNLSNLTTLWLGSNNLVGTIPPGLGSLSNLTSLWLDSNNLTGTIPPELGDLGKLTILGLPFNNLAGHIPSELGGLGKLTKLYLQGNNLHGVIPADLASLYSLGLLYLHDNPRLICWETETALDWALSEVTHYTGPDIACTYLYLPQVLR